MKIGDSSPNTSQVSDKGADSRPSPDDSGKSSFSKVLSNKRNPQEEGTQAQTGKPFAGDLDPSMLGMMQMQAQTPFDQTLRPTSVEAPHSVEVPAELQSLIKEISVVVNSPDSQQVHIELNSNVLKGLQIDIHRQDGAVAIQFHSTSDQVTNLLSTNIDALSQGLEDRGVNVSNIRIAGSRESGRTQDFKSGGQSRGGGQGGKGGGR
jgi:flagellar hook-length control protein FliK